MSKAGPIAAPGDPAYTPAARGPVRPGAPRDPHATRTTAISLLLAAVGAILVALLQSTIVPFVEIEGARPDLLLIYAVAVTVVVGIDHGVAAAFLGGTTLDALVARPLGTTAFVLLIVVGAATLIGRLLARSRSVAVTVAVAATSVVAPLLFIAVYGALGSEITVDDPLASILPETVYSTAIGLVVGTIAARLHRRYFERERIDW